ncbi:MAG: aquaporin [Methanomassiliicoccales archaeon]|nr:aquaporin [Methanomassiliicoccales archaeon]
MIAVLSPPILVMDVLHGDLALAVVTDALAVAMVLAALIECLGPISGGDFNPAVTLAKMLRKDISSNRATKYVAVQTVGALAGVLCTNLMFFGTEHIFWTVSTIERSTGAYIAELLGTFILVFAVLTISKRSASRAWLIGPLVGGLLLSTSSTMFANPALSLGRMFTYSAAGVRPIDGTIFIVMEVAAAVVAFIVWASVFASDEPSTAEAKAPEAVEIERTDE